MRKDYAKTKKGVKPKTNYRASSAARTTSRTKKKKQSAGLPVFGAALVLAVIGGLITLRVTHHGSLLQKTAVSAENSNASSAINKPSKEINTLPPVEVAEPTFDFYDVLPGENKPSKHSVSAATSREATSPAAAPTVSQKAPTAVAHPGTADTYIIQVASFAQNKEAQLFKQRLVYATGHTPMIEDVLLNGSHVYRVSLGPYPTLNAAMMDSNQLKQLGFTNILHRRAVARIPLDKPA